MCQWGVCRTGACPSTSKVGSTTDSGTYLALVAGEIVWQSVNVNAAVDVVGFGVKVTTNSSSTGNLFSVGLYNYNTSTGQPSTLVTSTSVVAAVEGLNEVAVAPVQISNGNYFLAVAVEGSVTISGSTTNRITYYCTSCFSGTWPSTAAASGNSNQPMLDLYAVTISP